MTKRTIKKRTLNELRQVKTYGYRPPSPSRKKVVEDEKKQKNRRKEVAYGKDVSRKKGDVDQNRGFI